MRTATLFLIGVFSLSATTRYVSTTGNDANLCTTGSRCASLNRAYSLSTNGDIILVAAGTYSADQNLTSNGMSGTLDRTPVSSNVVTIKPESGAVTFTGGIFFSTGFSGTPVQHIEFQDFTMNWLQIRSARDIHFTRIHWTDIHQWDCAEYISVRDSEIGPFTGPQGDGLDLYGGAYVSCGGVVTPGKWLIEGNTIHGISTGDALAHPDAIALDDGADVILRRNKFYNNCGTNLRISAQGPPSSIVVENNTFGPPVSCAAGASLTAQIVNVGTIVKYNTFDGAVQLGSPDSLFDNQLWEGNLITGQVGSGCPIGTGTIARYNVWSTSNSSGCGTNNVRVSSFSGWFVDSSTTVGDYHLTSSATQAIGGGNPSSYPTDDIDGTTRPLGGTPDAGADEFASGPSAPTVSTSAATNISSTTATGNGTVNSDGSDTITERGFVWSTSANPTTADNKVTVAGTTGVFSGSMTGLTMLVTYHYRAYATNSLGTSYGADTPFTTIDPSAINVVQVVTCGPKTFPATCTITASTAGNLIAVAYMSYNSAGSSPTMTSITDDASGGSNTYQQVSGARAINTAGGQTSWNDIWYSSTARGGATTLTITPSTTQTGDVFIWEISNVSVVHQSGALSSQAATTTPSAPALTTAVANSITLAILHPDASTNPTGIHAGNTFTSDYIYDGMAAAHKIASSTGTQTAQWDMPSSTYASSAVAFSGTASSNPKAGISGKASIGGKASIH